MPGSRLGGDINGMEISQKDSRPDSISMGVDGIPVKVPTPREILTRNFLLQNKRVEARDHMGKWLLIF